MTKFNIGDEVIYKGRMDRKGFIYKIADRMYWLREPDVPWGTIGAHFFRLNIYNDPYIQLYSDFLVPPLSEHEPEPPVTCAGGSPHYGTGCALLKHYDFDNDGVVTSMNALVAQNDGMTTEEVLFIMSASVAGSINAECPGCYTTSTLSAKGEIITIDAPATANHNERIVVTITIKNIGGESGDFAVRANVGNSQVATLAPNATYTLATYADMPSFPRTSATIYIRCIHII